MVLMMIEIKGDDQTTKKTKEKDGFDYLTELWFTEGETLHLNKKAWRNAWVDEDGCIYRFEAFSS